MSLSRDFQMGLNNVTNVIEIRINPRGREKLEQVLQLLSVIEHHGVDKARPYAQQAAVQLRKTLEFYPAPPSVAGK